VSYATSAISALDIWRTSLEDWDGAVDRYMQVTALPSDAGYLEAVKTCGLMKFTDKKAVERMVNEIRYYYDINYRDYDYTKDKHDPKLPFPDLSGKVDKAKDVAQSVLKALLIVAIVCTALVVAVIAILWKKHKGEEITNQTPPNPGYTEDPTEMSSIYQETEEEQ
ncbi:MAG: hypothetical protein IKH87_02435, partial [Firmicutes bacterium]|nr:hypothetical protein [Bacillota bacterium]